VGETISARIVNFARTGNPNGAGLPSWPSYSSQENAVMDFNEDGRAEVRKDAPGAVR
jgi:para-nitrobenzyl esterase